MRPQVLLEESPLLPKTFLSEVELSMCLRDTTPRCLREGQSHSLHSDNREQTVNCYFASAPDGDTVESSVALHSAEHPLH